jgi:hypothetical protein
VGRDAAFPDARALHAGAQRGVQPQAPEDRRFAGHAHFDVGLVVSGPEVEEVIGRILVAGGQPGDHLGRGGVWGAGQSNFRPDLRVAGEIAQPQGGVRDRREGVGGVRECRVERRAQAGSVLHHELAGPHAHQRQPHAERDVIGDPEFQHERGDPAFGVHVHRGEELPPDGPPACGREHLVPDGDHRIERGAQDARGRRVGAGDGLSLEAQRGEEKEGEESVHYCGFRIAD